MQAKHSPGIKFGSIQVLVERALHAKHLLVGCKLVPAGSSRGTAPLRAPATR